jgi:hypothetical protein
MTFDCVRCGKSVDSYDFSVDVAVEMGWRQWDGEWTCPDCVADGDETSCGQSVSEDCVTHMTRRFAGHTIRRRSD